MKTKKEPGQEPREAAKDEVLSRRSAIKRIAAGLAGVGIVVVAGMISPEQTLRSDEIGQRYGDAVKPPYGDSVKPPSDDSGPKNK
jgi:hypothetical protein